MIKNFGLAVFKDITQQNSPEKITSGLSGFKYKLLVSGEVSQIRSDLSTVKTYWDKFSSSQNSKKAVFELINDRVLDRLDSPDEYDLESFIAKAREIRRDEVLMKDAQDILRDKYGYEENLNFASIFDDLMKGNNIRDYYGAIYNEFGERSYGIVLRGTIGTYIETSESFTRGGTEAIIFRIVENDIGVLTVEHSTKELSYTERDGRKVLELKLSDDEIKEGWRIGVCKRYNSNFEYYEQALIAVDGKKLFGRFDFDYSKNDIVDRSERWYEDKTKWQYEWFNNKEVGISIFNPLSITYGGVSTFVYSRTDVSSQFLKHGIEYDWAKTYFEDSSWIITRAKSKEIIRNVLIKGIDNAKELFTTEELFEAYLFLCDYRNIYGQGSTESAVRTNLGELLGKLNLRQDVLTGQIFHGQIDEHLGRTKVEFEAILNTILDSKDDITTFFIEDNDGSVDRDFSFKQWINFVSTRIKDSDISKCKNTGVKKILSWAQNELNKIADLNMLESEYFDTEGVFSELKRGMRIFEIIIDIIGHSTFRFVVSHGISHSNEVGNIFTGLMDAHGKHQLAEYCNQFNFYPSIFSTQGTGEYKMSSTSLNEHKFSLFFGDSVIYFATKDVKGRDIRSSKNAYYLGNSLVSYLEEGYKVTDSILRDLESAFLKSYSQYVSRLKRSSTSTKAQMFLESNSFDIIARCIETKLEKLSYESDAERLYDLRRAELHLRIGLQEDTSSTTSTRYYLEQAITESRPYLNLLINGISVAIPTTKLTNVPVYGTTSFGISYENQHLSNKKAIDNRVEIFRDAIKNNEELNGKARFFITLDGDQTGIQYFKIAGSDTLSKYFKAHGTGGFAVSVDVDINNDPNNLLEKLARVSMTYQQGPGNLRFGLIMKSIYSDNNDPAYFVLNGDHFLTEDDIFSKEGISGGGARSYISLTGDSTITFTGDFNIKEFNERIDKRYFIYNLYLKFVKNLEWFV